MVATPAPPAPATTTTALEYEEGDSETKEEGGRVPAANGGGELGRGNFIGSADDGQIGQQTERQGSIRRVGGEGERSRDEARRCDIWILLLIGSEILIQNDKGERNKCMWGLSQQPIYVLFFQGGRR